MKKSSIKQLAKCANTIVSIFIKELETIKSLKGRKDIIVQLEKLTNLIIKLNKIKQDDPELKMQLNKKDEEIIEDLLKIHPHAIKINDKKKTI